MIPDVQRNLYLGGGCHNCPWNDSVQKQKQTRSETKALVIKTLGTQCKNQNDHQGPKKALEAKSDGMLLW